MVMRLEGLVRLELNLTMQERGVSAALRTLGGPVFRQRLGPPPPEFQKPAGDVAVYGRRLFEWVFREELLEQFNSFCEILPTRGSTEPPQVRFLLGLSDNPELSRIVWEAMTPPGRGPLSVISAFSRFVRDPKLLSKTTSRVSPVWETPVRILLIVSNPRGLSNYDLAHINERLEKEVLDEAVSRLGGRVMLDRLVNPSLDQIKDREEQGYHIVHLLAHVNPSKQGELLLANPDGTVEPVQMADAAAALASPGKPPMLVFLGLPGCAPLEGFGLLCRLAAGLIEEGVQSVVVLPSGVNPELLSFFMSRFYHALLEFGIVDLAVAEARRELFEIQRDGWEWCFPVLFTRTASTEIQAPLPEFLMNQVNRIVWS
jgi:hypothetical protein